MNDITLVDPQILVPHPDRELAGSTLAQEDGKYQMIKESILESGITDPLKVQSGTNIIIGGHTRRRIALELGITQVPVRYYDADEEITRYWMVTDNHKRIGDEKDLMKLAWTFNVVVKTIGFENGGDRKTSTAVVDNEGKKTIPEIAAMFDMKKRNFIRYLNLLDLTPDLQELVSKGKLGLKAGSLLSRLRPQTQDKVFNSIPESTIMRSDWYLTENEAKSLVAIYQEPETEDQEDDVAVESDMATESVDVVPDVQTAAENTTWVASRSSTMLDVDDDEREDEFRRPDIVETLEILGNGGDRKNMVPAPVEIGAAALELMDTPERRTVMDAVDNVVDDEGEFYRTLQSEAEAKCQRVVMIEDMNKRVEWARATLQDALKRQTTLLNRAQVEVLSLSAVAGSTLVAEVWDDLNNFRALLDQSQKAVAAVLEASLADREVEDNA